MEAEEPKSLLDQIEAVEGVEEEVKLPEEQEIVIPSKPIIPAYYTSLEG
jgi:antitoxin component of MazEF toxin-antitoxin module